MSEGWHFVNSLEQLERFTSEMCGFHDGIVKEVHWINRDFIDEELYMHPYKLASARFLVQLQRRTPSAVELIFDNVSGLVLDTVDFIFSSKVWAEPLSANLRDSSLTTVLPTNELGNCFVLKMERTEIRFTSMRWRNASDWMGTDVRFGGFTGS